jgi:hypothetical protein
MSTTITYVTSSDPTIHRWLREWVVFVNRNASEWRRVKDCPWDYTERPLLSILSGAAYSLGGYGFQEYASDKAHPDRRRLTHAGREDLYVQRGSRGFKMEAKHCWSPMRRDEERIRKNLEQNLERACSDASRCRRDGQERLGVLFAVPFFASNTKAVALERELALWRKQAQAVRCTGSAAVFPAASRRYLSDPRYISPGVGVFVKRV